MKIIYLQKIFQMETIQQNLNLSEEEKLKRLKRDKGRTLYDGQKPYCGMYSYRGRMNSMPYGFECPSCGNMIGFNLLPDQKKVH